MSGVRRIPIFGAAALRASRNFWSQVRGPLSTEAPRTVRGLPQKTERRLTQNPRTRRTPVAVQADCNDARRFFFATFEKDAPNDLRRLGDNFKLANFTGRRPIAIGAPASACGPPRTTPAMPGLIFLTPSSRKNWQTRPRGPMSTVSATHSCTIIILTSMNDSCL